MTRPGGVEIVTTMRSWAGGAACAALIGAAGVRAQVPPGHDFVMRDFHFASSETLPELRLHYRTFGTIRRNGAGQVVNAVLIMHGAGGGRAPVLQAGVSPARVAG